MSPLLRPSAFAGFYPIAVPTLERQSAPSIPFIDGRYSPRYPVSSPLDQVLRFVMPGSDEYVSEKHAFEIGLILDGWRESLESGDLINLERSLDPDLQACSLVPSKEIKLRSGAGIESFKREYSLLMKHGTEHLLRELQGWIGPGMRVEHSDFEIYEIEERSSSPLTVSSAISYNIVAVGAEAQREQRVGTWHLDWTQRPVQGTGTWKVARWQAGAETRSVGRGPGFVDVTRRALGSTPSYNAQMLHGSDHWRTVLDGACGIDVYGNNGIAAGDFDGDGFDDLYVCQPAGLPNRLYRNRGDGTFEDVTERSGVGVLDNTACALFADFRNNGRQDLLVVCGGGPLLFLNQGDGSFVVKRDAFQFARSPQGTFTHAAVADYDCDGHLDIYFCTYSYYLGLDQYHYPAPYFDARNGPPNFLLHNEGNATFVDRTEAAGMNAENNRYSFACAWGESVENRRPDLYVVNDFGRNNLYRNKGDGTFQVTSTEAQVEDVGAGMSSCWNDSNNDGRSDLYAANMWSAAGQRVSQQPNFHANAPEKTRELYRHHARGNALYRNEGDGVFKNVSEEAGVAMGRWAWCSDFWDFDHDGYSDLYVTNGYITAPQRSRLAPKTASQRGSDSPVEQGIDLGSFFWRQVVGKSPDDATPSEAYEHGWNALNELIRSDSSWSGHERNVMLANNRDGTFCEVSGVVGTGFLEDGRSFALADLDGDGRLEVVVKNRNAPQLRILHNAMDDLGDSIAFRLRGTKSNRDAIGAAITLIAGELRQTKYLQAGSGFLAQHSKEVFFGVGKTPGPMHATVRWPSGLTQQFTGLPTKSRIEIEEGSASFSAKAFAAPQSAHDESPAEHKSNAQQTPANAIETWLIEPLKAPVFALPDLTGNIHKLESTRGSVVLLHFWATTSSICREQLKAFQRGRTAIGAKQLNIFAVNVDQAADRISAARALVAQENFSYPVLFATDEVAGTYNIIYRYLYDRRANLAIPTSFLLSVDGMIVKVYQGPLNFDRLLEDARSIPSTKVERAKKALPFPGSLYQGEFVRNDFTYGVAMFQHGYLDQAAESFEQVIAARPDDPEAHYNLGTLNLRRHNLEEARGNLQQTLKLKPSYPEAWNNLGMVAAQQGRADEAIQNFQRSLMQRPDYATALLNLGNVYRHQHAFAEAQQTLTRALDLQPDDPEANYSLGMLYAQQDQLEPASQYLRKAVALRSDYPEALNNLGVLSVREQQYSRAEEQFKTCIRIVPSFEESYLNLARLYVLQHDKTKARLTLEDLLRQRPESAAGQQGLKTLDTLP